MSAGKITRYFSTPAGKTNSRPRDSSSSSTRFTTTRDGFDIQSYPEANSTPSQQTGKYPKSQLNNVPMPDYIPLDDESRCGILESYDNETPQNIIDHQRLQIDDLCHRKEEVDRMRETQKIKRPDSVDLRYAGLSSQRGRIPPQDGSIDQGSQTNPFVRGGSPSPRPAYKRHAQGQGPVPQYGERHEAYDDHSGWENGGDPFFVDLKGDTSHVDMGSHSYNYQGNHRQENIPAPIAENEPILCQEQADLVDLIMSGRNVFYTGSAGCGKSTVLKAFVKKLEAQGKVVQIMSPTGKAAMVINGSTTWSYMGWAPQCHAEPLPDLLRKAEGKFVWRRLKNTDVIVIDEISMVENLHFERMNIVLQKTRNQIGVPFGGVQMIVTGDFCQLPPVKPFEHCIRCGKELEVYEDGDEKEYHCPGGPAKWYGKEYNDFYHGVYHDEDKWAFRSNAWKICNFAMVNLTNIHRQSDKVFIELLQKLRLGITLSAEEIDLLVNHETKGINANAIRLFGTKSEVQRLNSERFRKLVGRARSYKCVDNHWWNPEHQNMRSKIQKTQQGFLKEFNHRYSEHVELKKGMAVVLLTNINIKAGLVNCAQGVVQGFKPYDPKYMPKTEKHALVPLRGEYAEIREDEIHKFIDEAECKEWPEVRFSNGKRCVIHADCSINEYGDRSIKPYTLLMRTQIPLAPGYAITTHKSQGMTLDKVVVDLSNTFEPGQAYVALSRARSLEGLKVESFSFAQLGADPQVKEFLQNSFPEDFPDEDSEKQNILGED